MLSRALNALTLGETGAKALGIDLRLTRVLLAIGVEGGVQAPSVAVTGMIGFVGLIVPHLMQPRWSVISPAPSWPQRRGRRESWCWPPTSRCALTPSAAEVRLGVAFAAVGGPFFLALLISMRRRLA